MNWRPAPKRSISILHHITAIIRSGSYFFFFLKKCTVSVLLWAEDFSVLHVERTDQGTLAFSTKCQGIVTYIKVFTFGEQLGTYGPFEIT
jgi:hypothetical protein